MSNPEPKEGKPKRVELRLSSDAALRLAVAASIADKTTSEVAEELFLKVFPPVNHGFLASA